MEQGRRSSEQRVESGEIHSLQRVALEEPVVAASLEGARELGRRYWEEVAQCMRWLVRVRELGDDVSLVFAGRVTLFRFGRPEARVDHDEVECLFPIVGGLLVGRSGGTLAVVQRTKPAAELLLVVSGYRPRLAAGMRRPWGRFLYSKVQAPLHVAVSHRFLTRVAEGPR